MIFLNLKKNGENTLLEYAEALHNLEYQHCRYDLIGYLTPSNFMAFASIINTTNSFFTAPHFCKTDKDVLVWCALFANEIINDY
jgi:hypothetical protein